VEGYGGTGVLKGQVVARNGELVVEAAMATGGSKENRRRRRSHANKNWAPFYRGRGRRGSPRPRHMLG
jgi:hypothetical protein